MTPELINAFSSLGPAGGVLLFVGIIAYLYARTDAGRRNAVTAERQKQFEFERTVAAARLQSANDTSLELKRVYNEIIADSKKREQQLRTTVDRLEKRIDELAAHEDTMQDTLDRTLEQNKRCQETLETVSQERDDQAAEKQALADENQDLKARLSAVETIQIDLQTQIRELNEERQSQDDKIAVQSETIARLEKQLTSIGHNRIGE